MVTRDELMNRVIHIHIQSHRGHAEQGAEHPAAIKSLVDLQSDLRLLANRQLKLVQKDDWELRP